MKKQAEEIQSDTDEPDPESIQTEQETEKETETETTAEDDKYPNYPGYPKEKDGLKLCKLYVDDYECFCDGYIKDEYPDKVFFIALEKRYWRNSSQREEMCGRGL